MAETRTMFVVYEVVAETEAGAIQAWEDGDSVVLDVQVEPTEEELAHHERQVIEGPWAHG